MSDIPNSVVELIDELRNQIARHEVETRDRLALMRALQQDEATKAYDIRDAEMRDYYSHRKQAIEPVRRALDQTIKAVADIRALLPPPPISLPVGPLPLPPLQTGREHK